MKTSSCKAKGRKGQQEVRDMMLDNGFEEHELKCAIMGESGSDIHVSRKDWDWDIEVKRQEKLSIWAALEQSSKRGKPCVFFKKNRGKWYVAMEAEDFLKGFNWDDKPKE